MKRVLLFMVGLICLGVARGEAIRFSSASVPTIYLAADWRAFVGRAAEDVAGDLEKILGARPRIVRDLPEAPTNALIVARGGSGWETYSIEGASQNVIRLTASDDRGAMFALYRFASQILGVDPFYFWSEREPKPRTAIEWSGEPIRQGEPSFRYRGWFINDEDFLNGLCPAENGRRDIDYPRYQTCFGPRLADRLYEAAVRSGFNTMICASYVDILNPDERRLIEVAAARGLYVTMHHQEPVGAGALQLDVHFPELRGTTYASDPEGWRAAWRAYIAEWAKFPDVIWMIGLRGRKDVPFWMTHGEKPPPEGEAEDQRRAALISQAMREQVEMIRAATGSEPRLATQLWMEGAELYSRGLLTIPAGTTIIFADNCPGLKFQPDLGRVTRLPEEGRYGLYYHLAVVIGNHRCELVPPQRTREVLADAAAKGAREMILINVSNVRPFLYTLAAAGEMTRDLDGFDATAFQSAWCAARFGAAAPDVSRAIDLYFGAYETVPSRDACSSYGAATARALLPILNDGLLYDAISESIRRIRTRHPRAFNGARGRGSDPDELMPVADDLRSRAVQDMLPTLRFESRLKTRAAAQSAAFARCGALLAEIEPRLTPEQQHQLFARWTYPTRFLTLASDLLVELLKAEAALARQQTEEVSRHLARARDLNLQRAALDVAYAQGPWQTWYDRDLIYPYTSLAATLNSLK